MTKEILDSVLPKFNGTSEELFEAVTVHVEASRADWIKEIEKKESNWLDMNFVISALTKIDEADLYPKNFCSDSYKVSVGKFLDNPSKSAFLKNADLTYLIFNNLCRLFDYAIIADPIFISTAYKILMEDYLYIYID